MNDLVDQAAAPDPWAEARAEAALNAIVFKHVDLIKGEECFIEVPRTETNVALGWDLYDGATVTTNGERPFLFEALGIPLKTHAGAPA